MTELSIIIVNYNVYNDVVKCIKSLTSSIKEINYEIIVIDNNSPNRDIENIKILFPDIKYLQNENNNGFAFANNLGMKQANGEFIFLVNPDIIFIGNAVNILFNFLKNNPNVAACGPVQHKPGVGIERYYTFFPSLYSRFMQEFRMYVKAPILRYRFNEFLDNNISEGKPFGVNWVIGSCLMVKKEVYKETNGMDETFFLYEEETEWQYRMRQKGWEILMIPEANVVHNHHSSAGKLGVLFVNYQEYRSRIIFDIKRFKGIKLILRRLMIVSGLVTRMLYFKLIKFKDTESSRKYYANYDLLKFALSKKEVILNDRYNFNVKLKLFR
ncbi:MAG: glycosyltransferase family 2 protein [Ignavibacteria bacterium]|nr:glycosyltransferase family 2 protein [Ignavibacteria bacterium]